MEKIPVLVKWAGGKRQLIPQLKKYFPDKIERYFEPFVGGGSVAFYVIEHYKPKKIYLSDSNEELINVYNVVKSDINNLIKRLEYYKKSHSKSFYYLIRSKNPKTLSPLERATRFIYLNRTCYNGLYRVNSKNEFNVPIGSYKNPKIYNEEELRRISGLLKTAIIEVKDFYQIKNEVKKGDFVYLDPPYYPLKKESFTAYTKDNFLEKDQIRLAKLFRILDKKGAKLMESNSDTAFIRNLYKKYNIHVVKANRMINSNSKGRGKINEVVITSY